ncbi:hypothetical protein C6499_08195 [Candidatus Poribacteria bacterium]|nr:MAG: hypothetical protein C6499_08195 [Candidatus Poribacteria bacterium]
MDCNKQTEEQTEVSYLTLSEFLQSTPPNQERYILNLFMQHTGPFGNVIKEINKPELELHCSDDSCNGIRFFRCTEVFSSPGPHLKENISNYLYVTYRCSNCLRTTKVYSFIAILDTNEEPHGICYKFGEFPSYGQPVPPRLIKLIGPDREIFLKGRNCENQGLGIGAFTYYRRVVENQKNRILGEIVKVFEKIGLPQDKIDTLREAIKETQFSKALGMAKDAMPESLLIDGHSPIFLLHRALSRGVHELTDEECLELASTIRLVLGELSEKLSAILKDKAELTRAVSTLMHHKSS